jgi:DNA-binding NarL/FixJ family response regulator
MTVPEEMTPRQCEIARLIAAGYTDKQIVAELAISDRRLRKHVARLVLISDADPSRNVRVQIAVWWQKVAA